MTKTPLLLACLAGLLGFVAAPAHSATIGKPAPVAGSIMLQVDHYDDDDDGRYGDRDDWRRRHGDQNNGYPWWRKDSDRDWGWDRDRDRYWGWDRDRDRHWGWDRDRKWYGHDNGYGRPDWRHSDRRVLPPHAIRNHLSRYGYRDFSNFDQDRGHYNVRARDRWNRKVVLVVNAYNGAIVRQYRR